LKTPKLSALGFGCKIVNWQPGDTLTPTSAAGVGTKIMPNRPCAAGAGAGAGAAEGQVRDRRQGNNSLVFTFCPAPVVENLFAAYVTPGQPNKPEKPTNQPVKPTISPPIRPHTTHPDGREVGVSAGTGDTCYGSVAPLPAAYTFRFRFYSFAYACL